MPYPRRMRRAIWYTVCVMDAHKSQTDTNSPSPTKDDEERCSRCGAILSGKNAGDEVCYCPNCGDFVAPLDTGEKPCLEERADIIAHPPRGVSLGRDATGNIVVRDRIPRRWIVAAIVLPFALAAGAFVAIDSFNSLDSGGKSIAEGFFGILVGSVAFFIWFIALCRLTARRLSLGQAAIVVDTLWLGFMRVRCRRFVPHENASAGLEKICNDKGRVKAISVGFSLGVYSQLLQQVIWSERGRRNEARAAFVHAVLDAHLGRAEGGTPFLCAKCGASIPSECIDAKSECLTCPSCNSEWSCQYAHYYRAHAYQSQPKFMPRSVEETRNGFIYRPNAWWNGAAKDALCNLTVFWAFGFIPLKLAKRLAIVPSVAIACAVAATAAASVLYFILRMLWGRFAIHRITLENGKGVYTCGFGKFEKKTEFVYDRETYLSIQTRLFNNPPSEYPIAILIGNDASAEEQPSPLAIFRLLPGEFYPWAIGRLFCAAAEIDPPNNA